MFACQKDLFPHLCFILKKFQAQNLKQKNAPSWKQQVYRPFLCSKLSSGEIAAVCWLWSQKASTSFLHRDDITSYSVIFRSMRWEKGVLSLQAKFSPEQAQLVHMWEARWARPSYPLCCFAWGVSLSLGQECWYLGRRNHSSELGHAELEVGVCNRLLISMMQETGSIVFSWNGLNLDWNLLFRTGWSAVDW